MRHREDGSETHAPLGIRLAQVVHHGTDHRSQICTVLTTLGIEPPPIDVWDFADHDGRAATVEDFLAAFSAVTGRDLEAFARWYERPGTPFVAGVCGVWAIGGPCPAFGEDAPTDRGPAPAPARHPMPGPRDPDGRSWSGSSTGAAGWWLGTAGIALALAAFGGISVASRRFRLPGDPGDLRVVGRTSLSPKQAIHLVRAGVVGRAAGARPSSRAPGLRGSD